MAYATPPPKHVDWDNVDNKPAFLASEYKYKTGAYVIDGTDYIIECNGTFNITLPTAIDIEGRIYIINNSGTGVISVLTTSSQTIDGETTQTLYSGDSMQVYSNNANWNII